MPRIVPGVWSALNKYLWSVWMTLLLLKGNPLLFVFSLRHVCQIHCKSKFLSLTPKIRVIEDYFSRNKIDRVCLSMSTTGAINTSLRLYRAAHLGIHWGHPSVKLSLRTHSMEHKDLLMLSFQAGSSCNIASFPTTARRNVAASHSLGRGKEARKCEILLIITKINCGAETHCR